MTAREAFVFARNILRETGIAEPDAKARVIVSYVLDNGTAVLGDAAVTKVQQRCH